MSTINDEAVDSIARRQQSRQEPLVLCFVDGTYSVLIGNWMAHLRRLGIDNVAICALDDTAFAVAEQEGAAAYRVASQKTLADLWRLRAEFFMALLRAGVDFVHSDVDAIWLRDPLPRLRGLNADLVFSQGKTWPPDVHKVWGFVLCCGLFSARATPAVAGLFERVCVRIASERDDQLSVNRELRDGGILWRRPSVSQICGYGDRAFRVFDEPVRGAAEGFSVAMLPHRECTRFPMHPDGTTLVAHPSSPKSPDEKKRFLSHFGLWRD